jgi:hypothetical protein
MTSHDQLWAIICFCVTVLVIGVTWAAVYMSVHSKKSE